MSFTDLHIVSFDVPWPANYGGVIDVYYKILALRDAGVRVHLHTFCYGRKRAPELDAVCASVHYYKRNMSKRLLLSSRPFIVITRQSEELMQRLLADDFPIMFEGLHCCGHLDDERLAKRIKIVRTHNIEHDYYAALAGAETSFFRRWYFRREARRLLEFEKVLHRAQAVFAISPADTAQLERRYGQKVKHVMAFHPNAEVTAQTGSGNFALYHGNLEVAENHQAAVFLVNEVFAGTSHKLVIAGNNPPQVLRDAAAAHANVELRLNISTAEIDELIAAAHINILPTFQATGIKLKLLAALFRGRYCLVNAPMIAHTGLDELCVMCTDAAAFRKALDEYFTKPFTGECVEARRRILGSRFSNAENARIITATLDTLQAK
ncbi:MAG: glycosyltransferase [Bacteroidia bacterium]|nr:glycosyltransferase [Bacteroidia bacterium]